MGQGNMPDAVESVKQGESPMVVLLESLPHPTHFEQTGSSGRRGPGQARVEYDSLDPPTARVARRQGTKQPTSDNQQTRHIPFFLTAISVDLGSLRCYIEREQKGMGRAILLLGSR
jgi:hypothetical protein